MTDEEKTREQLIVELKELRHQIAGLTNQDVCRDKEDVAFEIEIFRGKTAENKNNERSFRVSEDLLRAFTQAAFEGFAFTKRGYIVEANKQFAQIFGYEPEEVLGKKLKQFLAPEEHGRTWRVLRTDKELVGEYRGVKKDGTSIVFEAHRWTIQQKDRLLCLSSIKDITERKQMEHALRESEERFRLATESLGGLVYESDLLTGKVHRWSGLFQLLGYRRNEVPDEAEWWWGRVHPDDIGQTRLARSYAIGARSPVFSAEYRIRHANGQWLWVMDNSRVIYDMEGHATRMVGCTINVDDRKKAQESLRESEFRYRRLFESDIIGIAYADSNHIVDANDAFLKLVGYSAYDLRENRIDLSVLTPVEFTGRVKDAIRELLDSGSVKPFEKQCCRGDGSKISVLIGMALLNREPLKYICLALDITERKLMEDALSRIRDELEIRVRERTAELGKANEELRLIPGKLIAAQENERKRIAGELHDSIGQTLAALKFHVEHISITLKSGNTELALDLVDRIVPVLQRSINETRAIYMGLRPRMLEDMGIVVTLRWFCREMQNLYPNMHFEPEIDIEEDDVPEPFKIAIFRIAQEAMNNAAKYSKAEWVDLSLVQKDGVIRLVIADEGIGMDLDYIIQSATAKSLGLTGMKERVELTGGRFSIKSEPNKGTTVEAVWKLSGDPAIDSAIDSAV